MPANEDIQSVWNIVLQTIRSELSETTTKLWFGDLKLKQLDGSYAILLGTTNFKCKIVRERYREYLEEKMKDVFGFPVTVYLFSEEEGGIPADYLSLSPVTNEPKKPAENAVKDPSLGLQNGFDDAPVKVNSNAFFNAAYTFENFIVGSSNTFAYAACLAVAEKPASPNSNDDYSSAYNPLFIYGNSGLGKTHLLYAITNRIKQKHPELNIAFVKSEDFINQMIAAIANKDPESFRKKYRNVDVLLIDDIQFLSGKENLQEEFFHTFNALYEENKQIIMTSDRPPRDIKKLQERILTRFEWGPIVEIQPPDYELRVAILKNKAESMGIAVPLEVLGFLANKLQDNIRQLEGVLKKMGAKSFLSGMPITMDTAREAVSDFISGKQPSNITIEKILSCVAQKYNITIEELKGRRKTKDLAHARHISIYLIKRLLNQPISTISKVFERDHSTIMSSLNVIEQEIKDNPTSESEINEIIEELK